MTAIEAVKRLPGPLMYARKQRKLHPFVKVMERHVGQVFAEQRRLLLAGFDGYRHFFRESVSPGDASPLLDEVERQSIQAFLSGMQAGYRAAMREGATAMLAQLGLGISFDLENVRATEYIENTAPNRIRGINNTSFERIRGVLADAAKEGWSYNRTAAELSKTFTAFRTPSPLGHIETRAHLIAVTEMGDAYEQAGLMVAKQLQQVGIRMEKSWLTAGGHVCPRCTGNASQGWIPINEPFQSGHARPLAHPGCRCTMLAERMDK